VRVLKPPDGVDSDARGKESCKTVSHVFMQCTWVIGLRETEQNGKDDVNGYDMFVNVNKPFLKTIKMSEKESLNCFNSFGDKTAVEAYKRNKTQLLNFWYGSRLPPK